MKIANIGRFIIFIIIIGVAVGAYRMYSTHTSFSLAGLKSALPSVGGSASTGGSPGDIVLLTTPSKAGWIQDQVDKFNQQQNGSYHITLQYAESRQSMQDIINGKSHPVLWSPSSPIWISRLSEFTRQRDGQPEIDPDDINTCRIFLRTPLVVLTTREKQAYLERVFGSDRPWSDVERLSQGQAHAPWGKWQFSHADPLVANSGMLTVGLMLNEYSEERGGSTPMEQLATSPGFIAYMSNIEHGLLYDTPAKTGSQPLANAFVDDPQSRDFITAYESSALSAAINNPDLAVVYPNPTLISEQMVGIVHAPWVTADQAKGAQLFMQMLAGQDSMQDGLKYNMRPQSMDPSLTLNTILGQHASQGFRATFRSVEMPPYGALNDAAFQWRVHVIHQPT